MRGSLSPPAPLAGVSRRPMDTLPPSPLRTVSAWRRGMLHPFRLPASRSLTHGTADRNAKPPVVAGLTYHNAQPPLSRSTAKEGFRKRGRRPRRTGHNLIARLVDREEEVLCFLADPTVPFTNNQVERDIHMMKLRKKILGGFRSNQGAEYFATIRSFISTAKKQGWEIIEALTANPQALFGKIRLA
jgi:hypothetical protein